jgi:hypothetical protein
MKTSVQQAGTFNKIKKGERVRLEPTTNLPQEADEIRWFAEPMDGSFSMTINHDDGEYGDI